MGEIGFENDNFLPFFGGELGAVAFFELLDRFPPLLDHGRHDAAHFRIVEILLELQFFVHDGGLDHANHVHPQLVAGLHGELEIFGQTVV